MRAGRALREKWAAESRMNNPAFARSYNLHWSHGEYVSRVMQRYTKLVGRIEGWPTTDSEWDRWSERSERASAKLRAKCPCGDSSHRVAS